MLENQQDDQNLDLPPQPAAVAPDPRTPSHRRFGWIAVGIALGVLVTIVVLAIISQESEEPTTSATTALTERPQATTVEPTTAAPSTTAVPSTEAPAVASAAEAPAPSGSADSLEAFDASAVGDLVIPSVVTVEVNSATGLNGSGSGVVYDTAGHIVTNSHVVEVGTVFDVVISDGRVYEAELVGSDPTTDLAVLRVSARDLTPIELGSTDELEVGDPAVAAGSPLGLGGGPSLTVGVLSAFERVVQTDAATTLFGMLQTDAPITEGSSGGALVDANGALIGITTAVGVSSVGVEGIGFASPVEIVTRVADEIIAEGEASQPFLGITGSTAFTDTSDGGARPIGVEIEQVEAGSAAIAAGLDTGDVVTAFDGLAIDTMEELVAQLRRFAVGDVITLTVETGGGTEDLIVRLGTR